MPVVSPEKPARRAATRRKVVAESSDEDEYTMRQQVDESEEEFTPAPQRSPRRRKTTDVPTTPRTIVRNRRTRTGESVEPSQIFSPAESNVSESVSPVKKPAPRKRQSVRASRKSRVSIASDAPTIPEISEIPPPLPTPKPSLSPEPEQSENYNGDPLATPKPSATLEPTIKREATPLADITETSVNERTPVPLKQREIVKVNTQVTQMERPMDIVIRARNTQMPATQEPAVPKQRTVITYLVLTNFKSYAGRQDVGPFHASFSSVVGPNGSGKSNVIDSLLFVFGFRASKMRQGKISALIHNSAAFPDLDYCEVEVHFQEVMDLPQGGTEVVPDSTLIVSRRAFKNNSSKYYINGKNSDFTAVTTLLKDRGVDLDHKRFLILQGEVESIAQMKPKAANEHDDGLLEYLEDIIGTSKYKTPIEEAAAETENLNEVCQEKNSRVQHVEKEKNSLEDKKDKALAFVRDENNLATKQSALYQILIQESNDTLQATQEAATQAQEALDEQVRKHEGSEEGIKQLERQYKAGAKQFEALEKQTQAVLKEMAKLDKESVKFEEKKKFLVTKQKKLEKTLETSKFSAREAETLMKQSANDVERNSTQIAELGEEMKGEEKELATIRNSLKGKTQGLSDEIAAKQKSLEPWSAKINVKQSAMAVAQSELEILREKETAGAKAIEEVEKKIAGFEEAKRAKVEELSECKADKKSLEKDLQRANTEMAELANKEPTVRSKLSGARQKADEARASLSATQTQGNVLTGLMRLKESGRIDGFHGRLGNLGTIDQKYDVAISTACPSLDNLVVDSVEVGQQCIDYLRKNNLGRANFILLDRLPQRDLSEIDTPEDVPRLFDLVKSKHDKFRPAFYSVLQNTLVAKDLEQANRIAYGAKRWRAVTLDGQLIDKSGTMSGGGTRVAKGGMSSKLASDVTKEQVSKLEADRETLEQNFQDFQQQRRDLEVSLRDIKEQIPKLETNEQKLTLELASLDRNITDAQKRIQELGAEQQPSKSDRTRVTALERDIAKLEKEIGKLHTETAGVEEEIKALQDKIMEIGGVKLRGQKAKVDGLREQIDTLTEEMSTADVARAKAEKQKAKHEKAQVEANADLSTVATDLEQVESDARAQVENASGTRQQADEAQDALDTKKDELATLKKELDEHTAELNSTRGTEIEMRNKLEEHQKTLTHRTKNLKHWQEKLSKLSFHSVSDLGAEEGPEDQEATPQDLPTYTRDELLDMSKNTLKHEIETLEAKTATSNVDLSVLPEYRRRVIEHASRLADLTTALSTRDAAKSRLDSLRHLRLSQFMTGFHLISQRLKEMYQLITLGGNAELELVDSLDPFSEGILFSVMPPKKSWKNISNLSGGEKTLSSLALVFALHGYRPCPLYVMDEIDAALDFRNVSFLSSSPTLLPLGHLLCPALCACLHQSVCFTIE